jgi:hypothetical protein
MFYTWMFNYFANHSKCSNCYSLFHLLDTRCCAYFLSHEKMDHVDEFGLSDKGYKSSSSSLNNIYRLDKSQI